MPRHDNAERLITDPFLSTPELEKLKLKGLALLNGARIEDETYPASPLHALSHYDETLDSISAQYERANSILPNDNGIGLGVELVRDNKLGSKIIRIKLSSRRYDPHSHVYISDVDVAEFGQGGGELTQQRGTYRAVNKLAGRALTDFSNRLEGFVDLFEIIHNSPSSKN